MIKQPVFLGVGYRSRASLTQEMVTNLLLGPIHYRFFLSGSPHGRGVWNEPRALLPEKSHGKDGNPPMSCTIGGTAIVTIV